MRPKGSNFGLSLDLAFFDLKPLPTAINLRPFLSIEELGGMIQKETVKSLYQKKLSNIKKIKLRYRK